MRTIRLLVFLLLAAPLTIAQSSNGQLQFADLLLSGN
jgi:hypothetical protein